MNVTRAKHKTYFSVLGIALWVVFSVSPAWAEDEPVKVTAEQVNSAIERGVKAVRQKLIFARQWCNVGQCAIGAIALLNAGVPADDPALDDAISFVVRNADAAANSGYASPYNAGLVNMLLGTLKDSKYDPVARVTSQRLQAMQISTGGNSGGWGQGATADYSRTQFALLGLKAAEELGFPAADAVYARARHYIEMGQKKDGGWSYMPVTTPAYGSMTAACITSLYIVTERAARNTLVCGEAPAAPGLAAGLQWLGEHFSVRENPMHNNYHYYYLYALERIGVLTGQKYIGGHDWYREGAAFLVGEQQANGSWPGAGEPLTTEFALLFLAKGREPVVIQKLQYGEDWNPDPYDVKDLVQQASRELHTPMTTQVVDTGVSARELAAAPILYLQGHRSFSFTPAFREALHAFVDQGGFIFASACCGAADFDRSFRVEMKLLFPDAAFERLPANHDIYSLRHKITDPNAFMLEGLNTGCRTAVLYSPHDLCCAWGGCRGCMDKNCVRGQEAKNLGSNMIAYALGFNELKDKLVPLVAGQAKKDEPVKRGALVIGQLYHDGDWNPDPGSIGNLAKTMQVQFGMKCDVAKREVILGADELGNYPILYITGHKQFDYAPAQVAALRGYLDKGGFLLAEPCCGRMEFDTAFRRLCEELYPSRPLVRLPRDHPIMREPFNIQRVAYKPMVKVLFPMLHDKPWLEAVSAPDGRMQILYSRLNFGCELQGHACANCLGLTAPDAYKLAVNAIQYALAH